MRFCGLKNLEINFKISRKTLMKTYQISDSALDLLTNLALLKIWHVFYFLGPRNVQFQLGKIHEHATGQTEGQFHCGTLVQFEPPQREVCRH